MKETSENAYFYFMVGVCTQIQHICVVVRNKLQTITAYLINQKKIKSSRKEYVI